jgi:hypothetical protein
MPKGSKFSTILNWFREASQDEVRAIMPLVLEAVGRRKILISGPAVTLRQRKQRRLNGPDAEQTSSTMEVGA